MNAMPRWATVRTADNRPLIIDLNKVIYFDARPGVDGLHCRVSPTEFFQLSAMSGRQLLSGLKVPEDVIDEMVPRPAQAPAPAEPADEHERRHGVGDLPALEEARAAAGDSRTGRGQPDTAPPCPLCKFPTTLQKDGRRWCGNSACSVGRVDPPIGPLQPLTPDQTARLRKALAEQPAADTVRIADGADVLTLRLPPQPPES